ncbi:MAG: hypothetical protein AAF206_04155 [Bacteroidota bacterium]
MFKLILLAHVAATLYMVGLIWVVQVVHYPLFDGVGEAGFADYEARHARSITWIVLPVMMIELLTAIALLALRPTGGGLAGSIPSWTLWVGLVLVLLVWAVTFAVSVPQHAKLAQGFDARAHQLLVDTNWIRTAIWTLRGFLVLGILFFALKESG